MSKNLETRIAEYKEGSSSLTDSERSSISRECRALEKELGVDKIYPRDYVFLNSIRENLRFGGEINFNELAKAAGYTKNYYDNPHSLILGRIPRKVIERIIGIDESDVMLELVKMYRQDSNATAKLRALDLATKVLAMQGDEGDKILINLGSAIPIAD